MRCFQLKRYQTDYKRSVLVSFDFTHLVYKYFWKENFVFIFKVILKLHIKVLL